MSTHLFITMLAGDIMKRFSVYYQGGVVAGLFNVEQTNANLNMLIPEKPLDSLNPDQGTWSVDNKGEKYYVIRDS